MSKKDVLEIVKGIVISVVFSFICILFFAFILKQFSLSVKVIKPINQVIKVLVIFLGCAFAIRDNKKLIKGGIIGFFANFLEHIIYSLIATSFVFSLSLIIDIIFGVVAGCICGVIVNCIKKN